MKRKCTISLSKLNINDGKMESDDDVNMDIDEQDNKSYEKKTNEELVRKLEVTFKKFLI